LQRGVTPGMTFILHSLAALEFARKFQSLTYESGSEGGSWSSLTRCFASHPRLLSFQF
jgi:hypothetical protein